MPTTSRAFVSCYVRTCADSFRAPVGLDERSDIFSVVSQWA